MATMTRKATITYTIEAGQFGDVEFFAYGRRISVMLKTHTLRNDPETLARMDAIIGFNMWRWLGIEGSHLPAGVTMNDVIEAVLVARDEVADMGDCVLED